MVLGDGGRLFAPGGSGGRAAGSEWLSGHAGRDEHFPPVSKTRANRPWQKPTDIKGPINPQLLCKQGGGRGRWDTRGFLNRIQPPCTGGSWGPRLRHHRPPLNEEPRKSHWGTGAVQVGAGLATVGSAPMPVPIPMGDNILLPCDPGFAGVSSAGGETGRCLCPAEKSAPRE